MLNNNQLNQALAQSPAPRVTLDHITDRIADITFTRLTGTVTICNIELDNGFSVRGESACVNPENYNEEIGQRYAHDKAMAKLWELFGFKLAEDQHRLKFAAGLAMKEIDRLHESAHLPTETITDPEWFYRWASRAKAGNVSADEAVNAIFHCPGNPYQDNNPWAKTAENAETEAA